MFLKEPVSEFDPLFPTNKKGFQIRFKRCLEDWRKRYKIPTQSPLMLTTPPATVDDLQENTVRQSSLEPAASLLPTENNSIGRNNSTLSNRQSCEGSIAPGPGRGM